MKNLDKHEWDFSYGETYAIRWFENHGFETVLKRRSITADQFVVTKNGVSYQFRLPLGNKKIQYRKIMEQFERDFELFCEIERRRDV